MKENVKEEMTDEEAVGNVTDEDIEIMLSEARLIVDDTSPLKWGEITVQAARVELLGGALISARNERDELANMCARYIRELRSIKGEKVE